MGLGGGLFCDAASRLRWDAAAPAASDNNPPPPATPWRATAPSPAMAPSASCLGALACMVPPGMHCRAGRAAPNLAPGPSGRTPCAPAGVPQYSSCGTTCAATAPRPWPGGPLSSAACSASGPCAGDGSQRPFLVSAACAARSTSRCAAAASSSPCCACQYSWVSASEPAARWHHRHSVSISSCASTHHLTRAPQPARLLRVSLGGGGG